jgi:hypothetical protein
MVQLLAFSLQDQVEKYGAYIGIAAFFGLAVLSILYFAQARELRRLRDWAGRAPERAQELEARVVAQADVVRRTPSPAPGLVAATAAGAASRSAAVATTASAEPATQVAEPETAPGEPATSTNGTTAAAAGAPEAPAHTDGGNGGPPAEGDDAEAAAPATAVAPGAAAAAAAAKQKNDEGDGEEPASEDAAAAQPPEDAAQAPADAEAAEPPQGEAAPAEAPEDREAKADEPEAAAEQPPSSDTGEIPVAPVPRATPLPRRTPAPAAPLRQPSRSTTLPPRRPGPQPRRSPVTPAESNPRRTTVWLIGGIVGAIALVVVILVLTGVIGGGSSSTPPAPNTTVAPSTGTPTQSQAPLTPATTTIAVLNGTTIPGLASTEKDKLVSTGFKGKVTTGNNTDQARAQSQVMYGTRSGARTQARSIARTLNIDTTQRLDSNTRDLSNNADVVVIVGQDKAP